MRTMFLCKECQWKVKVEKCCLVWHNESGLLLFPEKSSCMALHSATGKQMQPRLLHRVPIQSRISFCFGRNPSSRIAFVTSLQRASVLWMSRIRIVSMWIMHASRWSENTCLICQYYQTQYFYLPSFQQKFKTFKHIHSAAHHLVNIA